MNTTFLSRQRIISNGWLIKSYPWITGVLVLWMAASGIGAFMNLEFMALAIENLGYPDYFHTVLGTAKILGALAILLPISHTLREWAYAGVAFETIFATISYAAVGSSIDEIMAPIFMLLLVLAGYFSWRSSRLAKQAA